MVACHIAGTVPAHSSCSFARRALTLEHFGALPACREIDLCDQFDKLFALVVPDSTSNKKVFEALVYSSYATLFLSG